MSDLREETILTLAHPEFINDGEWQRVDHPVLAPLHAGNADYGWEGDPRLAVYLHLESQTFVLWRLESDQTYRPVAQTAGVLNEENINRLCKRLVEIDTRRGFDPYADVVGAEDAKHADDEVRRQAWVADFSDKLLFSLARTHLPGVDVAKRTFTGFGG